MRNGENRIKRSDTGRYGSLCLLFLLTAFSGCASADKPLSELPKQGPISMIYSPNGEPLNGGSLGRITCNEALSPWFERVDTNHDDRVSHDEFMADAALQFQRMDIDKNGYLLPEELERYRLPYRQAVPDVPNNKGKHKQAHHDAAKEDDSSSDEPQDQGASVDPVMSADTGNHFKVTLQEYMTQAERIFTELDLHHDGLLSRDVILKPCAPKEHHKSHFWDL